MATELFLDVSVQGVIQQIVFGIASGGLYASLALALVLIYQAMETLNFAQGEMATFTTFIAFSLLVYLHVPYWLVFPATIVIAVIGGVLVERVIIRPVERAPVITVVLITIGLFAIFNGLSGLIWGYTVRPFPSLFPVTPINVGGIDSPIGAVVGGLVVGVLLALVGTYVPHAEDLRLFFGFVVIVIVLVVKPGGLFGRVHAERV